MPALLSANESRLPPPTVARAERPVRTPAVTTPPPAVLHGGGAAGAWWPAVIAAALLCLALAATFPPFARPQIVAAGVLLLCIGALMSRRDRPGRSTTDGATHPSATE